MKMTKKKAIIPTTLILVVLLLLFSFGSSCGCLDPDEDLADYLRLHGPEELTVETVQKGFEDRFPKGTVLNSIDIYRTSGDAESVFRATPGKYSCTYYIEHNAFAKRGYRVVYDIDFNSKVTNIKTNSVSNWFGKEIEISSKWWPNWLSENPPLDREKLTKANLYLCKD
jgi:hypothetical protein